MKAFWSSHGAWWKTFPISPSGGIDSNALLIRVGVEFGPAMPREGDLFGDAVNVAARMAAIAKDGQIITTEHCDLVIVDGNGVRAAAAG